MTLSESPRRAIRRVAVAGVGTEVELTLLGGGLARFTSPHPWIEAPGAVAVLAAVRGTVVPAVDSTVIWRVLGEPADGTITLVADTDVPVTPTVTATVGPFGVAIVHGVTNRSDTVQRVGLAVRLHPAAGLDAHCALCGQGPPDRLDVVGSDTTVVPGRPVSAPAISLSVPASRPLPGTTHVVHRLRSPLGAERLRIWGDADFAFTAATIGGGGAELELRTLPPEPVVDDLHEVAPGQTWMLSWGLQPHGFAGPDAPSDAT